MNQRELLTLVVGVFLTIIAWMMIDIYHVQNKVIIDKQIKEVESVQFKIDEKVFTTLKEKTL